MDGREVKYLYDSMKILPLPPLWSICEYELMSSPTKFVNMITLFITLEISVILSFQLHKVHEV